MLLNPKTRGLQAVMVEACNLSASQPQHEPSQKPYSAAVRASMTARAVRAGAKHGCKSICRPSGCKSRASAVRALIVRAITVPIPFLNAHMCVLNPQISVPLRFFRIPASGFLNLVESIPERFLNTHFCALNPRKPVPLRFLNARVRCQSEVTELKVKLVPRAPTNASEG